MTTVPLPLSCKHNPRLPDQCGLCFLYETDEKVNRLYGGDGKVTPRVWRQRVAASSEPLVPIKTIRFDEKNLFPEVHGLRFNSSIIARGDEYLLAFRNGWAGSEVFVATLDKQFQPIRYKKLALYDQKHANYGREDPRLFWYAGKLHVGFIGVVGSNRHTLYTNQLYARLSDELETEELFVPNYPGRQKWEKNWQFFEHDGELFASYSVSPHKVLHLYGNSASMFYETPTQFPYSGGLPIRGGASPVLVGDEWWCFFHSRVEINRHRVYTMGVCIFENQPPFRLLRATREPLLWADRSTKPTGQYASVVFPCGAVHVIDPSASALFPAGATVVDDCWAISCGIHDRWTELLFFDTKEIEKRLVRVT